MSIALTSRVWELDIDGPEREALFALCDHADDSGENCYPGIDFLAWKLGKSESQTRRVLYRLEERKAITVIERGNGRGNLSEYKIDLSAIAEKTKLDRKKVSIQSIKVAIDDVKVAIQDRKVSIQERKGSYSGQERLASRNVKVAIQDEKTSAIRKNHVLTNIEPQEESEMTSPSAQSDDDCRDQKPRTTWATPYYDLFVERWKKLYAGLPYRGPENKKDGDYVQMAKLKQALGGILKIEDWVTAAENYLSTPQKSHTIADLSVNFATFFVTRIDRFNRPAEQGGLQDGTPKRELAEEFLRQRYGDSTTSNGD